MIFHFHGALAALGAATKSNQSFSGKAIASYDASWDDFPRDA
jgi:hypothetical protein